LEDEGPRFADLDLKGWPVSGLPIGFAEAK